MEIAASNSGDSSDELKKGKMKAFLSLARFSDNQYQRIENYMKSSEFENKQALLKKAKEEVGLMKERRVQANRWVSIQMETGYHGAVTGFRPTLWATGAAF